MPPAGDRPRAAYLPTGTLEHRKVLWRFVEGHVDGPWVLGDTFSAVDVYRWAMTLWRLRRAISFDRRAFTQA